VLTWPWQAVTGAATSVVIRETHGAPCRTYFAIDTRASERCIVAAKSANSSSFSLKQADDSSRALIREENMHALTVATERNAIGMPTKIRIANMGSLTLAGFVP
jgi:hypothetical protein